MSDSEIKIQLIRLIDRQSGRTLQKIYEMVRIEMGLDERKKDSDGLNELERSYKEMSEDQDREEDAFTWIEGTLNSSDI